MRLCSYSDGIGKAQPQHSYEFSTLLVTGFEFRRESMSRLLLTYSVLHSLKCTRCH